MMSTLMSEFLCGQVEWSLLGAFPEAETCQDSPQGTLRLGVSPPTVTSSLLCPHGQKMPSHQGSGRHWCIQEPSADSDFVEHQGDVGADCVSCTLFLAFSSLHLGVEKK